MSSLTLPALSKSLDSFEQLLESQEYFFSLSRNSLFHMTIMNSNESIFRDLRQRIMDQGLEESLVSKTSVELVLNRKETAYIEDQNYNQNKINIQYTSKSGKNMLNVPQQYKNNNPFNLHCTQVQNNNKNSWKATRFCVHYVRSK